MAENMFIQFVKALTENEELQQAWKAAEQAYQGDKNDHISVVNELVLPFAASKGFSFTLEDVTTATTDGEIADDELAAVSGGLDFCIIIGGDFKDCGCVIGGIAGKGPLCTILGT